MKIKKINWRLITFPAILISIIINLATTLMAFFLYVSNVLTNNQIHNTEGYVIAFALFSPLVTFAISGLFVYFYRKNRKLGQSLISAILGFCLSSIILLTVTNPVGKSFYAVHDRKLNPCEYEETCGE